jgi:hypothetical protein
MKVTSHVTTSFGVTHVILKTITRTRTLKGGGFGLTTILDNVTLMYIKPSLQFQHKKICKDYKYAKTMDDAETEFVVIRSWWLLSGAISKEDILGLLEWLEFWHFHYRQWGGHMLLVSTYQTSLLTIIQYFATVI